MRRRVIPLAPKATYGSVPCACVLVSPLYYKPSVIELEERLITAESAKGLTLNPSARASLTSSHIIYVLV